MRKIVSGFLALGLLAGTASAVNNAGLKPSFADLTWYANPSVAKRQMEAKGYTFQGDVKSDGAVDSIFDGKLLGIPVSVRLWFNSNKQLSKTSVVFDKKYDTNLYADWTLIKSNIDAKYGKGLDYSTITDNAKKYDFMLDNELQSDKELGVIWAFPTYRYGISLEVAKAYANDSENYLVLAYESPNWTQEMARRQKSSDF